MNHTASAVPFFMEIRHVLVDNETWIFPFYWSVEGISSSNNSLSITALKLNNVTIAQGLNTTTQHGYNFRIVLELWSYRNQTSGFQFGWRSGGEMRSAWVQIWFNLTASSVFQNQTELTVVSCPESHLLNFYADYKTLYAVPHTWLLAVPESFFGRFRYQLLEM